MDKTELARISELPDYMPRAELEDEFRKLIPQCQAIDRESDLLTLEALWQLADRQWHNYELLTDDIRNALDASITDLWVKESLESTEFLLSVIGTLGLVNAFAIVKTSLDKYLNPQIRNEIEEAIREFGDTVANPYRGMPMQ